MLALHLPIVAASCVESPLLQAPNLEPWEVTLLADCPTSALGDIRPFHLIWNAEDVNGSLAVLRRQAARDDFPGNMTERERRYFASVQVLNGEPTPPTTDDAVAATRAARFAAYRAAVSALAGAFPDDPTAGSFVPFATLALGSVGSCASVGGPECDAYAQQARELAAAAYARNRNFPGTIHYGMHAHDYPNGSVYNDGLEYARQYPATVRDACHSLHMPSHISDRAGQWRDAAAANGASVAAADAFARLPGALGDRGGLINTSRGFGFAFNAGNLYHSLEFEAYELLQQCKIDDARDRLTRMGYAAGQALRLLPEGEPDSAAAPDAFAGDLGGAWYNATAYLQWQMRMRARQALWPLLTELMGNAAPPLETALDWRSLPSEAVPPPLSWSGRTVSDHSFYSPFSEASWHHAAAMGALMRIHQRGVPLPYVPDDEPITSVCSSADGCIAERVALALEVIGVAEAHYIGTGHAYEAAGAAVLALQVRAMVNLTRGDAAAALAAAAAARKLEEHANRVLLRPSSTTLLSLPAVALHGALLLMMRSSSNDGDGAADAADAFGACLAPSAKPQMPLCLLGLARAKKALGDAFAANRSYAALLEVWDGSQCVGAVAEARANVGPSPGRAGSRRSFTVPCDFSMGLQSSDVTHIT
ncbi:hypothetical protein EMIHUDRAFT_194988 [Emiliania huxleyi CCMP1516]|uniref:Uncharacterized protein n=2 Tax=Emiliania huxleyi TaxID=2903 RepID=A0A0D3JGQ7_EMIH1|nr:hypothetical protein EMIHUDRAFT_194988 [Emiliania huxleyi CCMP1516]EOD22692.1 hypothetical protein EMIHUDRAFT_194988 [Emiliania huxleyi CCMP1516]|eukprot:XP_005775121.1 hypothetical protein EMIHUDRAFT_194988 [Emiliania huxleyi CCMP1516]